MGEAHGDGGEEGEENPWWQLLEMTTLNGCSGLLRARRRFDLGFAPHPGAEDGQKAAEIPHPAPAPRAASPSLPRASSHDGKRGQQTHGGHVLKGLGQALVETTAAVSLLQC